MTSSSDDPRQTQRTPREWPRREFLGALAGIVVVGAGVTSGVITAGRDRQVNARGFTAAGETANASLTPVGTAGFGDTVPVLTSAVTGLGVQRAFSLDPSASLGGRWPVLTGQDAFNGRVEAWVRQAVQDYAHAYASSGAFAPLLTPVPGHAEDGSYVAPADAVNTADALRAGAAASRPDAADVVGFSAGSVLDTTSLPGSTRADIGSLLTDRAEFPAPQPHGHLLGIACDVTQATGTVLAVQLRASRAATIDDVHQSLFEQRQTVFADIASGTSGSGASLLTAAGRERIISALAQLLGTDLSAAIGTSKKDAPAYDPLRDALDRGTLLDDVSIDSVGQLVLRLAVDAARLADDQRTQWADGLHASGLLSLRVALTDDDCTAFGRTVRQAALAALPWSGVARAAATDAQAARTQVSYTTGDALPASASDRAAGIPSDGSGGTPAEGDSGSADAAGIRDARAAGGTAPVGTAITTSAVSTQTAAQAAATQLQHDGRVRPSAYAWPTPCDLVPCAAVTFDDGPSDYTESILAAFASAGSHASFMVEGQHAVIYPQEIRDEIAQGHTVCNHTWDHPALTDLTSAQVADQLTRTDDAVTQICGVQPAHVRPPYGFFDDTVSQASPHPLVLWDVDSLDWEEPGQNVVHDKILREAKAGSIVLMHDVHEPTMQMMSALLHELRAHGLTLVNLDTLLARVPEQQTQNVIHRLG